MRNVVETVHLSPLHGTTRLGGVGVHMCHVNHLESVKVAGYVAAGGRAVLIDQSHGQFLGQSFLHQGGEEQTAEQRGQHHAEKVDGAACDMPKFA